MHKMADHGSKFHMVTHSSMLNASNQCSLNRSTKTTPISKTPISIFSCHFVGTHVECLFLCLGSDVANSCQIPLHL